MVIIGAGEAGARAAMELRTQGWLGSITLIGEEMYAPYERPPLSKQSLIEAGEVPPVYIMDNEKMKQNNIDFICGMTVTNIDRDNQSVELVDGMEIRYEKLLLTTGARPRKLIMEGSDTSGVHYLRTQSDVRLLREKLQPGRHIAIIGAGFIGLEVAASAISRGCSVTVIEVGPRILMRGVPEEIARIVEGRHREAGVAFKLGIGIQNIHSVKNENAITLADGTVITSDVIIAGIGATPMTSLASSCGLVIENGISVDETLATSDPHIFAAGDCCSIQHPLFGDKRIRLEAWRNAQDQGTHAARSMMGQAEPYTSLPWFWSDQYELTLQVTGLADLAVRTIHRDLKEAHLYFHLNDEGRLVSVSGIGENAAIAKEIRIGEMLIEKQAKPDPEALADPSVKLKSLLR
ncbi:ferredoxin reductase [Paenibacillus sp. Soil787]|nr:ferredoxin reductase [Paenibacillus sp. Soil787]